MTSAVAYLVWVYLIASVPFALVFTTLEGADTDVRAAGSGNPGATNVARLFGWQAAAPVLMADIGKGFAAVVVARLVWPEWDPYFGWIVAVAAFFAHCYSVWLEFRGGKGVATAAGGLLAVTPFATLISAAVWVLVLWISGRSSVASLAAALGLVGFVSWLDPASLPVVFALTAGIAWTHLANMRRLVRGEEAAVIRPVRWGPAPPKRAVAEAALAQGPAGTDRSPAIWKEATHDPLDPTGVDREEP